jgi:hypothetical protein
MEDPAAPAVDTLTEVKVDTTEASIEILKPTETTCSTEDIEQLSNQATDSSASLNTYTTTRTSLGGNGNDADSSGAADQSSSSETNGAKTALNESNDEYKSINDSLNQNTSSSSSAGDASSSSLGKKLPNDSSLDDDDAYEDLDEYDDHVDNYEDVQDGSDGGGRKPLSAYAAYNDEYDDDDDGPINTSEFKLGPEFEKLSLSTPPDPTKTGEVVTAVSTSNTRLSEKLGVDSTEIGTVKKGQFYGHDDSRGEVKEEPSVVTELSLISQPETKVSENGVAVEAAQTDVSVSKLSPERWSHDKYNPAAVLNTSSSAQNGPGGLNRNANGRKPSQRSHQTHRNANNISPPKSHHHNHTKNGSRQANNAGAKSKGISLSEYLDPTTDQPTTTAAQNGTDVNADNILNSTAISNATHTTHLKPQRNNHLNNARNNSNYSNGRRTSNENSAGSLSSSTVTRSGRHGQNQKRNNQPSNHQNNYTDAGNGLPADLKKRLDFSTKKRMFYLS